MSKRAIAREARKLAASYCIQVAAHLVAGIELADVDTALSEALDVWSDATAAVGPAGGWS